MVRDRPRRGNARGEADPDPRTEERRRRGLPVQRAEDRAQPPRDKAVGPRGRGAASRRARIAEDRLAAGGAWAENDLVFCNALGEPESLDRLSMVARRVKDRLGLPSTALPVHGLRHLVGASMNRAGKDAATIRDQLGHSDVRTTLQFYVTVDDDQRQESADLLGDLFG